MLIIAEYLINLNCFEQLTQLLHIEIPVATQTGEGDDIILNALHKPNDESMASTLLVSTKVTFKR